ncbi:hypothetical protein U3516DRAFT_748285 [Neocallimastix sp. 'constans']
MARILFSETSPKIECLRRSSRQQAVEPGNKNADELLQDQKIHFQGTFQKKLTKVSTYQINNILKELNIKSDKERFNHIKRELEKKIFNLEDDISLFISELNILFNDLENLNSSLLEEEKFNYLYTSISRKLAIEKKI